MAFGDDILENPLQLGAGEVIETFPHSISSFDKFEDGLIIGRFCKYDSGSVDNLDGSATPQIVGVPKRKVNKAISSDTYVSGTPTSCEPKDANADVCNFGYVTVACTDAAVPVKGLPVYVINGAANADNGKVTQDSGETDTLLVADCKFEREVQTGVWVVVIQKYLV